MTDKATVTIPSPRRGKVLRTFGEEGDIAKVHGTLVILEVEGAGGASHGAPTKQPGTGTPAQAAPSLPAQQAGQPAPLQTAGAPQPGAGAAGPGGPGHGVGNGGRGRVLAEPGT